MKRFFLLLLLCCSLPMATMAKSPKDSYYFQRAVEAMESGDNETAIRYLSEELDQHPTNGYAHTMVAYMLRVGQLWQHPGVRAESPETSA